MLERLNTIYFNYHYTRGYEEVPHKVLLYSSRCPCGPVGEDQLYQASIQCLRQEHRVTSGLRSSVIRCGETGCAPNLINEETLVASYG